MDMTITPMTADDLPAVMAIEENSFTVPWSEGDFRELLDHANARFLCARLDDGTVCGYIGMMSVMEIGDILNVAVHGDFRRRQIGRCLMEAMEELAVRAGVVTLLLEVRESNLAARGLYAAQGYAEIAVRKNYYRKPTENAVIMRKLLDEPQDERREGDAQSVT